MIYSKSTMATLFYSKDAAYENWPCTVKIDDNEILVEYDNDGLCQYPLRQDSCRPDRLHTRGQRTTHWLDTDKHSRTRR